MNNNYDIIEEKLDGFLSNNQIPNIIFYGDCNANKEDIVNNFLYKIVIVYYSLNF